MITKIKKVNPKGVAYSSPGFPNPGDRQHDQEVNPERVAEPEDSGGIALVKRAFHNPHGVGIKAVSPYPGFGNPGL